MENENYTSIFLFSESSRKCVELKTSVISRSDLISLQRILPRNLKGVSFHKPTLNPEEEGSSEFVIHSETRAPYVSKYLAQVGKSLLHLGEALGALRFFDFYLKIENNLNLNFLLLRARALIELGQIDEAAQNVDQIIKENPENGFAYFLFAKIYFYQSDYKKSIGYFEKAKLFLSKEDLHSYFADKYLRLNQLFLDRDTLSVKTLSVDDLVREIESLQQRIFELKSEMSLNQEREIKEILSYLENTDKLLNHWRAEMMARFL